MKKILFLLFAAAAFAACNDDDGEPKVRYATTNDGIENGYLQGANLHFYGTSTVYSFVQGECPDLEYCDDGKAVWDMDRKTS